MVFIGALAFCWLGVGQAQADPAVASVQQTLKAQGFYYGEITGTKDADTSAAIRRYQIRNGLQITGELNAETRKSLGVSGGAASPRATPRVAPPVAPVTPRVTPPRTIFPDTSDLRDDGPIHEDDAEDLQRERFQPAPEPSDDGLFDGTPYEGAPRQVQQRIIVGAQALLARQGYYRSGVDGVFGPGTQFALRAYQSRFGLEPTGAFDFETLAALGLLPQQQRGYGTPRRRVIRRGMFAPDGERVYIPR